MTFPSSIELAGEAAMLSFGQRLALCLPKLKLVFLHGDLGAGKTTLVRGMLRGLGHEGRVRSPTYTLMEPYVIDGQTIMHLDLYRIGDAEELELLGLRDVLGADAVCCLVEWPDKGRGWLPTPDLTIGIEPAGTDARQITLEPRPDMDEILVECLKTALAG